jgi:hypothetical protein
LIWQKREDSFVGYFEINMEWRGDGGVLIVKERISLTKSKNLSEIKRKREEKGNRAERERKRARSSLEKRGK